MNHTVHSIAGWPVHLFVSWHLLIDVCLLVSDDPCYSLLCFSHIEALAGFPILLVDHSILLLDLCLVRLAGLFSILTFTSYLTLWL